ncbi:HTH-type transcriptional regulator TsaR [Cupriavidus numazuensis]|uniref:HTH-type transcriptional regulator TsaR n=2 Tax=Cupriavidus numazuensis TaxID=221992 RepID=A0ABM8TET7_9BURK|nr:HTH-type transcriptional regulator TsaR [Cupriavidus numazuensis]
MFIAHAARSLVRYFRQLLGAVNLVIVPAKALHPGSSMKLKQLQALRAVAETGSLQAAARRLCVTQPAVSRAIIELEGELGLPVLIRAARGASLTEFGASILKRALVIDREVGRIYDAAEAMRGTIGGRLTIAITPASATRTFVEAITAFTQARPEVQVSILELRRAQIVAGLDDGSLDVALFPEYGLPRDASYYQTEALYEIGSVLAVSSLYRGSLDVTVADLQTMQWMVLDAASDESSLMRTLFAAHDLAPPSRVLRCSSAYVYAELVTRMNVVSTWSDAGAKVLNERLRAGTMRRLNVAGGTPRGSVCVAYPNEDLMTAAARDFIAWLRTALRKPGSADGVTVGID